MTTPGHQAGPTPANGGHAPGNDLPDRDGAPGAGNSGYDAQDSPRRHEAPEEGYGRYDSPEDRYSSYAPSGPDLGWSGPQDSEQGRGAPPPGAPGRHGTPENFGDWFRPSPGGPGRYAAGPGNGPDRGGAPAGDRGWDELPPADDGRYGSDTARMSPPDTRGRPHARHAAGPDRTAPDRGDPAGASDRPENRRTEVYRPDAYQRDPYQPDAYQQPDPYQGPGHGSHGYPGQGYPGQGYPGQGYPGQGYASQDPDQGYPGQRYPGQDPDQGYPGRGYASEADWVEAKWTGADRAQAVPPPTAAAPARAAAAPGAERTAVPPPGAARGGSGQAARAKAAPGNASLLRSSSVMAVGTLASRLTGFVRNAVIIYAIGTLFLGDAYNLANTLPNIVYNLALGGILTSVVVPLLVNAAKRDADHGEGYDQRIFTLGVLALGGITLLATVLAQPITAVYAGNIGNSAAYHLTVIFAYFFIPQIFFYGVSSLAGAILNARGSFAAPMWTPVINNLVVIVVGVAFMVTAGLNRTPSDISAAQVQLLGIGTTLGIVLQTVALIPSMRRVGFRWRPRRDFRRAEISEIGHMSGWMFGYVLTTQISFLVTTRIANVGGAGVSPHAVGAGFAAYSNAYTLFQLPYAIVGISVITALLPRMSAHAAERKYGLVSSDFSTAVRLASVVVVPAALILAVLGAPLAEAVFGYGSTSVASARYVGEIFAVFSLGLLPFTLFQLLLRVFYAMHDSRTPALISVVTMVINIVANLIALAVLPPRLVVAGLGAGFGLASLAGTVAAWRVLSRRIGGLGGREVRAGLVKMHAAAIPGAIFAIAIGVMVGAVLSGGRIAAFFTVAIGGAGAMLLYVLFAKSFGVAELNDLTSTVRSRLR
jgi:putative peptidoglycan lipid II flippase